MRARSCEISDPAGPPCHKKQHDYDVVDNVSATDWGDTVVIGATDSGVLTLRMDNY
jgi:hypothetical protein